MLGRLVDQSADRIVVLHNACKPCRYRVYKLAVSTCAEERGGIDVTVLAHMIKMLVAS